MTGVWWGHFAVVIVFAVIWGISLATGAAARRDTYLTRAGGALLLASGIYWLVYTATPA